MAFTFVNGNAVVSEIDVFDTKAGSFQQTKPAPVKEMGHKAIITLEMSKDGTLANLYVQMREQAAVDKLIEGAQIEEVDLQIATPEEKPATE